MKKFIPLIAAAMALVSLCACARRLPPVPEAGAGGVVIRFDYQKQSGHASNQFAVWIEDASGNLVKTLYATRYTANGGYKNRPDSIPLWVEKSGLAGMSGPEVDAVAGATPKSGTLEFAWDLTGREGKPVAPGTYWAYVEGSLRWKNRVLYSQAFAVDGLPHTFAAAAEYFYEGTEAQPALTSGSPENAMIGPVTVRIAGSDPIYE